MNSIKKIAVIGLGYVGLPLALLAETKGFQVIGIDLDQDKIAKLKDHEVTIDDATAAKQITKSKIEFTAKPDGVKNVDAVIICVPTPVDSNKTPDLRPVIGAVKSTASLMKKDSLMIIESTINPGVCNEVIIPLIEKETDHIVGKTLHVAHCPERINPGDPKWHVGNINRVLGSDSQQGLDSAHELYTKLIDAKIKKMGSLKEAEAVKVVENSFRDINIAFVNELAMSFDKLGINVNNVIDGAATKPFAFMAHYPGIGVGGHCIPVDPYYLIEYARTNGFEHKFLSLARNINESMPIYAIDQAEQSLIKTSGKNLSNATVAVLGLSYKANVGDDRESPSYKVIEVLKKRGATVKTFDPYITKGSTEKNLQETIEGVDITILATGHKQFLKLDPADLPSKTVFLDGRNALISKKSDFVKADVAYLGIGLS